MLYQNVSLKNMARNWGLDPTDWGV